MGFVLLMSAVFVHLITGSVQLNFFTGKAFLSETNQIILKNIRLPKVIVSLTVGAGLSVAGLQMQTLFRNALAGPSILGISSGASMGVALVVFSSLFSSFGILAFGWGKVIGAFIGALLVMLLILILVRKVHSNLAILIVGIMIGSATTAVVGFLQYISKAEDLQSFVLWTLGSTFIDNVEMIFILMILTFIALTYSLVRRNYLKFLLLPKEQVDLLGVDYKKLRLSVIITTCVLVGSATAFCGPISFVGLAVPHAVRFLTKNENPSEILGLTILYGMGLMVLCSWIASFPGSDTTLPINIVTSIIGAPVVILLILRSRQRK